MLLPPHFSNIFLTSFSSNLKKEAAPPLSSGTASIFRFLFSLHRSNFALFVVQDRSGTLRHPDKGLKSQTKSEKDLIRCTKRFDLKQWFPKNPPDVSCPFFSFSVILPLLFWVFAVKHLKWWYHWLNFNNSGFVLCSSSLWISAVLLCTPRPFWSEYAHCSYDPSHLWTTLGDTHAVRLRCFHIHSDNITSRVSTGTGDVFLQAAPERHSRRQAVAKQTDNSHGCPGGPLWAGLCPRLLLRGSQTRWAEWMGNMGVKGYVFLKICLKKTVSEPWSMKHVAKVKALISLSIILLDNTNPVKALK